MNLLIGNLNIHFGEHHFLGPLAANFGMGHLNLVVGRSGCGKSTLLKLVAGFHKDYTGAISIDEEYFDPQGKVALAFQNPESLFFNDTVFEEIAYAIKSTSDKKINIESNVNEWMKKWGLDPEKYSNKYPFHLSGGEKRRVALAACTILKPSIILLDEPLAGLDRDGQRDLSAIINSLVNDHIVIVVTHEPELLLKEDTQVLYIGSEQVIQLSSQEFLTNAVMKPEFYPLPDWYRNSVAPYSEKFYLPMVNAQDVFDFLEQAKNEPDNQ